MQKHRLLSIPLALLFIEGSNQNVNALSLRDNKRNSRRNHKVVSSTKASSRRINTGRSLHSLDDYSYVQGEMVEKIACSATPITYESWIGVDLIQQGSQHFNCADDVSAYDLGYLLRDAYRVGSALHCDPLQRVLTDVTFSQCDQNGRFIYKVNVTSSPSSTSGNPPLLELADPPQTVTFTKTPSGQTCDLANVLESKPDDDDDADDDDDEEGNEEAIEEGMDFEGCDFLGCYCPSYLLPAEIATSGLQEEGLVESLQEAIAQCQIIDDDLGPAGEDDEYYNGGKKAKRVNRILQVTTDPPPSEPHGCLPNVTQVDTVLELQPITPCDERTVFETLVYTTISEDPCTLNQTILDNFLKELILSYNRAQFNACDFALRQIEEASFVDVCSNRTNSTTAQNDTLDNNILLGRRNTKAKKAYAAPWTTSFSSISQTSKELTTRRRAGRRQLLKQETTLEQATTLDEKYPLKDKTTTSATSIFSRQGTTGRTPKWRRAQQSEAVPQCFCPATAAGPTEGITEEQFLTISAAVMDTVSNGSVAVIDQFEVDSGCPEGNRENVHGAAVIALNVDVYYLFSLDIEQMERDCTIAYNSFVREFCPPSFTQINNCEILQAKTYYNGGYYGPESPNDVLFVSLYGSATRLTTNGQIDPVLSLVNDPVLPGPVFSGQYTNHTGLDNSTLSINQTSSVETLPSDLCLCEKGSGIGRSPTAEEFATFLNHTGVIKFAQAAERVECIDPMYYSQIINATFNGDCSDPIVQSRLGVYLQDTFNRMSIERCIASHFYVIETTLLSWERPEGQVCKLQFQLDFVAYNNGMNSLYVINDVGRALSSSDAMVMEAGDNLLLSPEAIPLTQKILDPIRRRQLQMRAPAESSCFCMPGAVVTSALDVYYANQRIRQGAMMAGVTTFRIV